MTHISVAKRERERGEGEGRVGLKMSVVFIRVSLHIRPENKNIVRIQQICSTSCYI